MRREIWRISDQNQCCNANTGEPIQFLTYDTKYYNTENVVRRDASDATLEELAHLCDHDAENRNAHDFCGSHRLLAAWLYRRYGRKEATSAMLDIAKFGGLHGMGGVGVHNEDDAYTELGVGINGRDWNGTFGD